MSKTGHLITNMQKYATEPEWEPLLDRVMREHIEYAADAIGVDPSHGLHGCMRAKPRSARKSSTVTAMNSS